MYPRAVDCLKYSQYLFLCRFCVFLGLKSALFCLVLFVCFFVCLFVFQGFLNKTTDYVTHQEKNRCFVLNAILVSNLPKPMKGEKQKHFLTNNYWISHKHQEGRKIRATKWLADVMERRVHKVQDISSKCLPSFIFFLVVLNGYKKINHRNGFRKVNNIHSLLVTTVTDQTKENFKP